MLSLTLQSGPGPASLDLIDGRTSAGGGRSSGSDLVLDATVGQVLIGESRGMAYRLLSGVHRPEPAGPPRPDAMFADRFEGAMP
ncbi:MAG: hypothetical protein AAGJ52_06655 [Pseudomonadota bacterium]